ncbi:MAG: TolC family protein [Bacteriovorax sp.]|nr:TolC family protein [Bacteriovorax sp.]
MKSRILLPFFIALLIMSKESFGALTLKESYESALHTNQNENIAQSLINQSFEQKRQFQGNYLPVISGRGKYLKEEKISPALNAIGLNFSQSIYKGGRDSYLIDSADKNIAIAENQKIVDRITLYINVIQAYYTYFLTLNDYKNLELLKKQSKERVDETRKRVQVGRSRRGELLQAEAQLATAEALLFNGDGLFRESAQRFYILTGLNKYNDVFNEVIQVPEENQRVQAYLDTAYSRPDVKSRELKIQQAELNLDFSKSFYYPTLNLDSNYYLNKRAGALHNSDWDIGLVLNIPLYEGGVTKSLVRESVSKKEQAIYTLADFKKSVELDITVKYETYHRYLDQVKAFDLALDKTKKSYEEAVRDYRLGLVSNLDVLASLNLYLDSKINSENTKIQAMLNLKLLEASAGILP